jgi:hypothetical protein
MAFLRKLAAGFPTRLRRRRPRRTAAILIFYLFV